MKMIKTTRWLLLGRKDDDGGGAYSLLNEGLG